MGYEDLTHDQLVRLIPELLLGGHLMDRAAMPHVIGALGREGMEQVAIEEWRGASPHYTRRMRNALGLTGQTVTDMFKCLQHDVGAPPQFMDFRYTVTSDLEGGFELAHCGALMDVEPMGPDYVKGMCHTIEDPTFDATAIATHPQARIRPLHRPPRVPADRSPHCAWRVFIDPSNEPLAFPWEAEELAGAHAVTWTGLAEPDDDYRGALLSDVDWAAFGRGLLVRLAQEIALQWHLLGMALERAIRRRLEPDQADELLSKAAAGIAGWMSRRLCAVLAEADVEIRELHPMLAPQAYTGARWTGDQLDLGPDAPGVQDGGWLALAARGDRRVLDALNWGLDPEGVEPEEVRLVRFSTGADFGFMERRSLPIVSVT